ncbi:hypothetical protein L2E82_03419 [Cichorium intybus]|uniref:Uncharacterized protein n=1 Tax=Cichorium intybus TaxID=13427 RepID=A0ACB9H3U1_CICIN|nr:hypothetical protein L2E82_03419 [Cichorium intybus]
MSNYLCEELIDEIFTRLPTKSLLRFRALSKFLCSYIGSPGFIRMHTFRSPQKLLIRHKFYNYQTHINDCFYTLHSEEQLPVCSRPGYIGITPIEFPYSICSTIVGSCNGILCLFDNKEKHISVWTPSIRRKLTLPHYPWGLSSAIQLGFGFDPITDDYNIVKISYAKYGRKSQSSFVYAVKTGTWCEIASPTPLFSKVASNACFVNGALHWVVERSYTESHVADYRFYILTFDLSTHVFGMIPLPVSSLENLQLLTIQGLLAVICMDNTASRIWVRRDASWSLLFNVKTDYVGGRITTLYHLTSNGDLVFNKIGSPRLQVYNPKRGAQSTIADFNVASRPHDIVLCVESLQMLDMGTACKGNRLSNFQRKKKKVEFTTECNG